MIFFPQNSCIHLYYVIFQDSTIWDSAKWEDTVLTTDSVNRKWFLRWFAPLSALYGAAVLGGLSFSESRQ